MTTNTFGAQVPPRITAVSYSRMKTWAQCPAKANYKFVQKLKEPDSMYAARGTELHKMCEDYLNAGCEGQVPPALDKVGLLLVQLYDELESFDTELQISFDADWQVVDWFSPATKMRVVYDVLGKTSSTVGLVVDHKSGRVYDDHHEQLELYALTALIKDEELEEVDAYALYIDQGHISPRITVTRDDMDIIREKWEAKMETVMSDTVFAPSPNRSCRWCHFRRSNGGPCDHG